MTSNLKNNAGDSASHGGYQKNPRSKSTKKQPAAFQSYELVTSIPSYPLDFRRNSSGSFFGKKNKPLPVGPGEDKVVKFPTVFSLRSVDGFFHGRTSGSTDGDGYQ